MSLVLGLQIWSLSAMLVATPPLLPSVTLYVWMGRSLKDKRSGVSTGTELARFILPLESNCLLSLMKIIFGALYMIPEDSVLLLLFVKASTVVLSLSAIRTSLRTVLRTLFLLKISLFIPGENIRLWLGLLAPTIPAVHMCQLRVKKASIKDVNMSIDASFLWNGKESLFRDIWIGSVICYLRSGYLLGCYLHPSYLPLRYYVLQERGADAHARIFCWSLPDTQSAHMHGRCSWST